MATGIGPGYITKDGKCFAKPVNPFQGNPEVPEEFLDEEFRALIESMMAKTIEIRPYFEQIILQVKQPKIKSMHKIVFKLPG